jgi:hypothetical protein
VKKTEIVGAHEMRGDYENPYKTVVGKPYMKWWVVRVVVTGLNRAK